MNDTGHQSDDPQLSSLLRQARTAPALPPRFQQNVWRRLEAPEPAPRSASWLDALASLVLRPRLAFAAAVLLLVAGAATGTVQGRQMARQAAQVNYVASVTPSATR
jgi:hypothetical protein